MRTLTIILLPPLLIFAFALLALRVPLPSFLPPPLSGGRNLIAAVSVGFLGLVYLVLLTMYIVLAFSQSGRGLDVLFAERGLASSDYLLFGRRYEGEIAGRRTEVRYLPPRGASPGLLEITVDASLGSRIALGGSGLLLDCGECASVAIDYADMSAIQLRAENEECPRALLADASTRATLMRLIDAGGLSNEIYLQPDRVWFRAHWREVDPVAAGGWLDNLLVLAETAELVLAQADCTTRD